MVYWYVYRNDSGCIVVAETLPYRAPAHGAECYLKKADADRRAAERRERSFDIRPVHYLYAVIVIALISFADSIADYLAALF